MGKIVTVNIGYLSAPPPPPPEPGVWPTAATTGTTGALTPSTQVTFNTPGEVVQNKDFTDLTQRVQAYADNVSFINCRFRNGLAFRNVASGSATSCEMNGDGIYISSSQNVTIDRCKVIDWDQDAMHVSTDAGPPICSGLVIKNNYVYHSIPEPMHHADGIQIRGVDGMEYFNNYVDFAHTYDSTTDNACFFIEDNYSDVNKPDGWLNYRINCYGNYFKGGGYTCYLSNGQDCTFSNNTIASVTGSPNGYYYPGVSAGVTGTGNVAAEDGHALPLH